jgi:hypothetical protein
MRFVFHPHDGAARCAYAHPGLDLHDQVMIPARLVELAHPEATKLVLEPGQAFDVNEKIYPWGYYAAAFFKSSQDFVTVNQGSYQGNEGTWYALSRPGRPEPQLVEQEAEQPRRGPKGRHYRKR